MLAAFADPPRDMSITRESECDGMGAIYQVHGRAFGVAFAHVFLIDLYAPPRSFGFSSVGHGTTRFRVSYDVEQVDAATRVRVTIGVEATGWWRLARPMLGRALQRAARDAVACAKTNAERSHASGVVPGDAIAI